jgi:hypothetical protein
MKKWLLSYDPEIESHPFTLVQVDTTKLVSALTGAIQFTSHENALAALTDPSKIDQWTDNGKLKDPR